MSQTEQAEQSAWPERLPVVQVRIARPTKQLQEVVRFYSEGLGLRQVDSFSGHQGYSGVMLGLPGRDYHLEFTEQEGADHDCRAPTRDNLLVFYMPDSDAIQDIVARMSKLGYSPIPPENPYWEGRGVTFEDPDGWRIVLMNTAGI